MDKLFHFTDTARLPWILQAGELRPGRNKISNTADPDFLWATPDINGDRTAAACMQAYRSGQTQLVRFTLTLGDFEPWPNIVKRYQQWTREQIERLEQAARQRGSGPERWHCRVDALPAEKWLAIETKSYSDKWKLSVSRDPISVPNIGRGVIIDRKLYLSQQFTGVGPTQYEVYEPMPLDGEIPRQERAMKRPIDLRALLEKLPVVERAGIYYGSASKSKQMATKTACLSTAVGYLKFQSKNPKPARSGAWYGTRT